MDETYKKLAGCILLLFALLFFGLGILAATQQLMVMAALCLILVIPLGIFGFLWAKVEKATNRAIGKLSARPPLRQQYISGPIGPEDDPDFMRKLKGRGGDS